MNTKVFVVTEAEIMGAEKYVGVFASEKAAEKFVRGRYPNARKDEMGSYVSFLCKSAGRGEFLMFIHREQMES